MKEPSSDISLEQFQQALAIYQRDLVAWTLLYGAFTAVSLVTFGLGLVLAPNVFRATRDALEEERPPKLDGLFRTDRIVDDAIVVAVFIGAPVLVSSIVGPLSAIVGILLGMAPTIGSDARYSGLDALKLSVSWVVKEPIPVTVHSLVAGVLTIPALCCLFPFPFVLPVLGISTWLFYLERREAIDALAEEQGVPRLPER